MKFIKLPVNFFEDPRVVIFKRCHGEEGVLSLVKLLALIAAFGDEVVFDYDCFPTEGAPFDDDDYVKQLCILCDYKRPDKSSFCVDLESLSFVSIKNGKWASSDFTKSITSAD